MPRNTTKAEMKKLKASEVEKLKGKLIEVRKIGAHPIFISVTKTDTIAQAMVKADVPTNGNEIKVEAVKTRSTKWQKVSMKDKVYAFDKIAVTTKVAGSF